MFLHYGRLLAMGRIGHYWRGRQAGMLCCPLDHHHSWPNIYDGAYYWLLVGFTFCWSIFLSYVYYSIMAECWYWGECGVWGLMHLNGPFCCGLHYPSWWMSTGAGAYSAVSGRGDWWHRELAGVFCCFLHLHPSWSASFDGAFLGVLAITKIKKYEGSISSPLCLFY